MELRRFYRGGLALGLLCAAFALTTAPALWAQASEGRIEGRISDADGDPIGGVTVVLNETGATAITDSQGSFLFSHVPAGTYSISLSMGDNSQTLTGVSVSAAQTTTLKESVPWKVGFAATMTVFAASRRVERIVEAPAAVTTITEEEVDLKASSGQIPKLLEFTPGAEVTQSGLYDYNFNTRGFNSSLNRRVATLIDGRDPSVPFLGAQEWAAISFPLDDIASLEMIRGPSAALYGKNASSGVLNITTKQPRYSEGGEFRLTGGELDSFNLDGRWAGHLGSDWYLKVTGGLRNSGDFSVSRRGAAEYSVPCAPGQTGNCLPQEAVPLARTDDNDIWFGSIRLDKYLENGSAFTVEGGIADIEGPLFQTGIGRVQLLDVQRPWARFNFNTEHFNFLADYTGRDAPKQLALASGANLALNTDRYHFEGLTNWSAADDRVRIVAGASATHEEIDSFDPERNRQTLMFEPIDADFGAVFGQLDWSLHDKVKLVLAGRFDDSSLHDAQFSPKAALVFGFHPDHSLRLTYNEAFQVANYSEFFLQAPVAPPVNLSQVNGLCLQFGIDCGLGVTPVLAVGNEDLELEEIRTYEIGYSGILADRAYLTLDYYISNADNFITDLLPQLGTALGRVNPNFGPWQGPAGLPQPVVDGIRAAVPLLSNNFDGSNILVAASYANFGEVDTQGIDFGLNYYASDVKLFFSYSWFDFDIKQDLPGFASLLVPNTPENKFSAGIGYNAHRFEGLLGMRWVDEFRWAVGPFQGDVESYTTVDLDAKYAITDQLAVGVSAANLFDNEHWESFGGDLLGRRALGYINYRF